MHQIENKVHIRYIFLELLIGKELKLLLENKNALPVN